MYGMDWLGSLIPLLFVGVAAGAIWLTYLARKKRREAAQAFARAHGWTYTESVPSLTKRWRSAPFGRGHSLKARDVITGTFQGMQVVSFEYEYTTGGGKNRSTWTHHVVALSLPVRLPWLQLTPDGAGAAIAKFFGGQDIDFESKRFNEAWRVKAPPGQYAFDFIHPRMMERLLARDAVGRNITVEGADLYLHVSGRQVLEAIDVYVNLLYGIYDLIPRHLWLKAGYDPLVSNG